MLGMLKHTDVYAMETQQRMEGCATEMVLCSIKEVYVAEPTCCKRVRALCSIHEMVLCRHGAQLQHHMPVFNPLLAACSSVCSIRYADQDMLKTTCT